MVLPLSLVLLLAAIPDTWAAITGGPRRPALRRLRARGPGDHQVARTRPLGDVVAGAVREFVTANMRRPKDERELRREELVKVVGFALQAAAAERLSG